MRLSMATTLLNLRADSSFRAVSFSPVFPASSRMSDCCFSEHFHAGTVSIEVSGAPAGGVCLTDDVDIICEQEAPRAGLCVTCEP